MPYILVIEKSESEKSTVNSTKLCGTWRVSCLCVQCYRAKGLVTWADLRYMGQSSLFYKVKKEKKKKNSTKLVW